MSREQFIEALQNDIERWKVEVAKTSLVFPVLGAALDRWIAEGERLLNELKNPSA